MACGGSYELLASARIVKSSPSFPRKWNEPGGAAGEGIFVAAHAPADAILHRAGAGFFDQAFQVIDFLLGRGVAAAASNIELNFIALDVPDELTERLMADAAEHVENGELDHGNGAPECESLEFIVVAMAVALEQVFFQSAGIFADEVGRNQFLKNRAEHVHAAVVDGDAFGAVFGADTDEMIFAFLQQLDGIDDDGFFEGV